MCYARHNLAEMETTKRLTLENSLETQRESWWFLIQILRSWIMGGLRFRKSCRYNGCIQHRQRKWISSRLFRLARKIFCTVGHKWIWLVDLFASCENWINNTSTESRDTIRTNTSSLSSGKRKNPRRPSFTMLSTGK